MRSFGTPVVRAAASPSRAHHRRGRARHFPIHVKTSALVESLPNPGRELESCHSVLSGSRQRGLGGILSSRNERHRMDGYLRRFGVAGRAVGGRIALRDVQEAIRDAFTDMTDY